MSNTPAYLAGKGRGRGRGGPPNNKKEGYFDPFKRHSLQANGKDDIATRAEERFLDIKTRHQEAAKRHISQLQEQLSVEDDADDDDNEEIESERAIKSVLQSFADNTGHGDVGKTEEYLSNFFKSDTAVCLICLDNIKKNDAIWCCCQCFLAFHIPCIQKWVKDGVYQTKSKLSDENFPHQDIPWNCPNCRLEYKQSECPTKYVCYCCKVKDPKYDPWLLPHSCGQQCGKALKPQCGHKCVLFCHPGPCPPCPKTVSIKCHCGKHAPQARRCGAKLWSCGKPCARLLSCKHHNCNDPCHAGDCGTCEKTSIQKCLCCRESSERPCAALQWQCTQVCGKVLGCGNHLCEQVCHAGNCGPCPRSGNRSCPCGKSKLQLPCTQDVPTCGDTCGKLLDCGLHTCAQRCHTGPCGACRQMVNKRCHCGARQKEVLCFKDYFCETRCNKMKDCSRHPCKRKCCDSNCPQCEQPCGKTLGCKKHKCNSRCHPGRCYPCPLKATVNCFCKSTSITVRCGREKLTKPPRCSKQCSIPTVCNHAARDSHRCHFGRCPPCKQTCSKNLDCGHICPAKCHVGVLTKVIEKVERIGPWEAQPAAKIEKIDHPCPPCLVPVPVVCLGEHGTVSTACSEVRLYSCANPCGRQLACANHTCSLECHKVIDAVDNIQAGSSCAPCEEPCAKKRPEGCTHRCIISCHPQECPPCELRNVMRCHCGSLKLYIECSKWTSASETERNDLKTCKGQCPKKISCGHLCPQTCHSGKCCKPSGCQMKVLMHCSCKRKKKGFSCVLKQRGEAKVECDEVCKKNKEKKEQAAMEADMKILEEEERKRKVELEKFERKFQPKRKSKQRAQRHCIEEKSFYSIYGRYMWISALVIAFIGFTAVVLFKS